MGLVYESVFGTKPKNAANPIDVPDEPEPDVPVPDPIEPEPEPEEEKEKEMRLFTNFKLGWPPFEINFQKWWGSHWVEVVELAAQVLPVWFVLHYIVKFFAWVF
jgi:hypothetical protein